MDFEAQGFSASTACYSAVTPRWQMLCALSLSWTIYRMEHADTSTDLWMCPRWGACPLLQKDFLHNIVYLNINFQFRLQLSKMYCSAPKWGQEQPFLFFFFLCLDFFHHAVDNKDRHSAHDSPAIDHWCSWLPKHGVHRGHLSARIHLCPLQ